MLLVWHRQFIRRIVSTSIINREKIVEADVQKIVKIYYSYNRKPFLSFLALLTILFFSCFRMLILFNNYSQYTRIRHENGKLDMKKSIE